MVLFPSSHCSDPLSTPLPHNDTGEVHEQLLLQYQARPLFAPSSHTSQVSTVLLPQNAHVLVFINVALSVLDDEYPLNNASIDTPLRLKIPLLITPVNDLVVTYPDGAVNVSVYSHGSNPVNTYEPVEEVKVVAIRILD